MIEELIATSTTSLFPYLRITAGQFIFPGTGSNFPLHDYMVPKQQFLQKQVQIIAVFEMGEIKNEMT